MIETMITEAMELLPYIGLLFNPSSPGSSGYSPGAFKSKYSPFPSKGTGMEVDDPTGIGTREIDTSNIDFGNKQQVMNIQQALIDSSSSIS